MEINPYRFLVQLIPGILFVGTILLNEMNESEIEKNEFAKGSADNPFCVPFWLYL